MYSVSFDEVPFYAGSLAPKKEDMLDTATAVIEMYKAINGIR